MTLKRIYGYQLVQASLVTNHSFMRSAGDPYQLRPVEFTILQLIRETPHTSPSQLAKTLAMTAPSITNWIDKLTKRKLLKREKNARDGRGQQLVLTSEGLALVDKAMKAITTSEAALVAHLSVGERELLLEILEKIQTP